MAKAPTKVDSKNELAPVGGSQLPAYLQNTDKGSHLQGMDSGDFIVPRIKLLQGISPEVEAFEEAKSGEFWLNVLDISLGASFRFIPVNNRKRYLLLPPIGDDRGVLARADDGKTWNTKGEWDVKLKNIKKPVQWVIDDLDVRKSGLAEFGSSNPEDPDSNPAATLFYEYLVWLPDVPELPTPVLLSLARSQAKKARDLNGKIEFGGCPMQAMAFKAGVVVETGAEGPYNNYQFAKDGYATEEQFETACRFEERFRDVTYSGADEAGLAGEGPTANAAQAEAKAAGEF